MEYTINVAKDAKYNFAANVATGMEDGAAFSISIDGTSVASVNVPYTNDWKTYTAVKGTAGTITAGNHVLRIDIDKSYVNIDNIAFTEDNGSTQEQDNGDIDKGACTNNTIIAQFSNLKLKCCFEATDRPQSALYPTLWSGPQAMVYNGRVYVYMTNDILEYSNGQIGENKYGTITEIDCISSSDLVNWTDHGPMKVAGTGGISKAVNSWAPTACHVKINGKDKFFLLPTTGTHFM